MSVPIIVARGIVFSGFATLPEGMVAHSKPRKAKNVNVAVVVIAAKSEFPLVLKGIKFCNRIKNKPPTVTSKSGIIFKTVVTSCNLPDVTIPNVFIQVRSQMAPNPVTIATTALVASIGKKVLNALTNATAIAALVHRVDIQ